MVELWLNFKDENGEVKRIPVTEEKFTIGRTADNNLPIPIGNLSRQHAKIDKFADIFVISDSGSSNGTTLNGVNLTDPIALKNGDKVNLGGGIEIEIEMISDDPNANASGGTGGSSAGGDGDDDDDDDIENPAGASASASSSSSSSKFGGFGFLLILVPIFGLLILAMVGGFLLISNGIGNGKEIGGKKSTPIDNFGDDDTPKPRKSETPVAEETSTPVSTEPTAPSGGTTGETTPTNPVPNSTETPYSSEPTSPTKPGNEGDNEKARVASAQFLRKISTNDPNIFLTIKQTNVVNDKIKTVKSWSGLAENIKDAKRNSTKLQEIARSKNLTPQFLTAAVLTELGSQRGDVVAKANEIVESLADLSRVFGGELANDTLLTIASFDGKAGKGDDTLRELTKLSAEFPNRQVRSIWFMQEKNKISEAQFDKVIRFLAVGSITQNPKEFNVNAEAVSF